MKKTWIIAIIIIIILVVAGVYCFKNNTQSTSRDVALSSPSENSSSNKLFPTNIPREPSLTYKYPSTWTSVYLPGESVSEDNYTLTKKIGDNRLELFFQGGINGVGGACPDYDPSKEVVSSNKILISGSTFYLIYSRDIDYGSSGKFNQAYLSDNSKGECPNLPFVKIPGIKGLFKAVLGMYGKNDQRLSLTLANPSDLLEAENILSSIKGQ